MLDSVRRLSMVPALLLMSAACNNLQSTSDVQMSRMDATMDRYGAHHTHMVDNAILRDMSVADIHFVPHTAELSGVGEARLSRMAKLLHTYGGTVRYETLATNEEMIRQRLAHVREYLALTGCNMERVEIAAGMAGGRGMPGDEAVAKFIRGTAQDDGDSGSTTLMPNLTSSQQ